MHQITWHILVHIVHYLEVAAELYKLMVIRKQTMDKNPGTHDNHPTKSDVKPIDILKVRLAKVEITKGEYEELRKIVA